MPDTRDTRLANLRALLAAEPGPDRGRQARFAKRIGKAPAQLSQWMIGYRTIDDETARHIEGRLGLERWAMDAIPNLGGSGFTLEHPSAPQRFDTPPLMTWEGLMQSKELPAAFVLALPDDALAGLFHAGTRVVFERSAPPKVGKPVLVQDRDGLRWVRLYGNVRGTRWQALATGAGHATLDSEADGLVLLAAARWVEL